MPPSIRFKSFRYNRQVEPAIRRSTDMERALAEPTKAAAAAAQGFAPVRTGRYRDSIHGTVEMASDGWRGKIVADDFKSGWIEFGSIHIGARHPLQRGAQAAGLRFRDT